MGNRIKSTRRFVFVAYLFAVLFSSGCLFIDKRNAEAPLQDSGGRTPPLSSAELLSQLSQAFQLRNPSAYLQAFDNSGAYLYTADAEAASRYGAALDSFTYAREERFAQSIFSRTSLPVDSASTATFTIQSDQPQSGGSTVEMTYTIQMGLTVSVPRQVSGRAVLTLVRGTDGGFVIRSWRDNTSGNDPTLADWKARIL